MRFDSSYLGDQGTNIDDRDYIGSRFAELREQLFSNAYYDVWGGSKEPPLPTYEVSLGRVLRGLFKPKQSWKFLQAAKRTLASRADMRWGKDGRGFRRLLHPNGICMFGTWKIEPYEMDKPYTGYFSPNSEGLILARYSTCCTETRRGHYRSLSMVGKLFPTRDKDHSEPLIPAAFITQEDLGGARSDYINQAELRNAPNTSPWRRGLGFPILLLTGVAFSIADLQIAHRQLFEVAELGKADADPTISPEFMRFRVSQDQPRIKGDALDFRDEIMEQIYDRGIEQPRRKLCFDIEVSDHGWTLGMGVQRRFIRDWNKIGTIEFDEAVISYNSDFVIHFHHPPWRRDRNDPSTVARPSKL